MSTIPERGWKTSLRGAFALFLLGMTGVIALAVSVVPSLRAIPELASLSFPLLVAIAAANSTVLLALFVLLGAATAPRVDLRSHVYTWATRRDPDWDGFRDSIPTAVGIGTALFVLTALLDAVFAPFVGMETGLLADAEAVRTLVESIPMRLLYGGITEELLLRWGLMAPVAWTIWRVRSRFGSPFERRSVGTMWAAIGISAVVFGLGHLPALATSFGLTPALILRTVALNAMVGIGLGWLFWRRSLETAMVAHVTFHVALVATSAAIIVAS